MIEIKETDVVYKLDKNIRDLKEVQIPENATVFDASNCENFSDLKGLKKYPNLRVLLLRHTAIRGLDLQHISPNVEEVDIRGCQELLFYYSLPERPQKPLHVLISFGGDTVLNSIPKDVNIEIGSDVAWIAKKKQLPIQQAHQNTKG